MSEIWKKSSQKWWRHLKNIKAKYTNFEAASLGLELQVSNLGLVSKF